MKQILVALAVFGMASCGRLDQPQYLPPNQQQQQGFQSHRNNNQQQGGERSFERSANADIPIVRLDSQNEGDGNYLYALETGNGIQAQEQGKADEAAGTQSQGSYSYTSPEGEQIQINYQAGENGFLASGSHIPTAPPVPAEIQKALEQNLADEARGIVDDGQYRPEHESEGNYQQNQYQQGAKQYVPPKSGNNAYKY